MRQRAWLLGSSAMALLLATQCGESSSHPPIGIGTAVAPPSPGGADGGSGELTQTDAGVLASTQALMAGLQQALNANAASYGAVDMEDLTDLLTYALLRAQSPGGRGVASASCAQNALVNGFAPAQASMLCGDMIEDSATCATRATFGGMDRDAAVALCTRRGEAETADCALSAFYVLGSSAQAVAVCSDRDGATTAQCVSTALSTGFDHDQAVALCAHRGSLSTVSCASLAAQDFGFSHDQAVSLCAERGTEETATCAGTAVQSLGFSRPDAVTLCAGRGESSNVTCARNLAFTNLTRAQTIATCRRQSTW